LNQDTIDALLAITLVPGLAPVPTRRLLEAYDDPRAILAASPDEISRVAQAPITRAQSIFTGLAEVLRSDKVKRERELVERLGVNIVTVRGPEYPALLRMIDDPPPVLFYRGALDKSDAVAIAIVGSRRCSTYGREQADRFASMLSQSGLTIVSGGALGVDAAAHRAAIRVKGRTLVVIGSGLANPYPRDNAEMFDQIVREERGVVMSELPMTAPPAKENFPARNRIVSGLSLGVLVVEAPNRSGALITARLASEEHGREVLAIPGPIDRDHSSGCNRIIREGWAALVTSPTDVLDSLGETGQLLKAGVEVAAKEQAKGDGHASLFSDPATGSASKIAGLNLTPTQQRVLEALASPLLFDQLAAQTSLPVSTLQADLTMLQIRGLIKRDQGRVSRSRQST
jgi:DNA processing protein